MFSSFKCPEWRRIYLQTLTLMYKNFLIFCKAPISTVIRTLIFPIVLTVIFCELKHVKASSSSDDTLNGISKVSYQVKDLADAATATSSHRLVFVRNGISNNSLGPVIDGILQQPRMDKLDTHITDDPDDLFHLCHQTVQGTSDCFAAIIFTSFNETNVEYIIALDSDLGNGYDPGDYRTDTSLLVDRLLPIQWAVDSNIGNISASAKPSGQPWSGSFGPYSNEVAQDLPATNGPYWLSLVNLFVAPFFILILIGSVYQVGIFVATERQTSMAELMAAQRVTNIPRILSTLVSFLILYFPGFLVCSILLTQILFIRTSDILFLFLTLLAGTSLTVSSHFLASFFSKAQLAGLYISVLAFALSLVILADTLASTPPKLQIIALALFFPPITWSTLISDVASREYNLQAFTLGPLNTTLSSSANAFYSKPAQIGAMDGYLYVVFFIVQIVVFGVTTYLTEQSLWGVTRKYGRIEANSDVAVRCTSLSKTYYGKRPWYWPFKVKGSTVLAVDKLDLEVKKGSVTFLLGPNGGGKTTTLKCIAGMIGMDSGSSLELGDEIFGICPQHNVFWGDLTVQEHIKIWRKLKTAAFQDLEVDDDDVLGEVDLVDKGDAPAKTLSGGQMRKLQLAISFVGGSKVCCIDEASSGLDPLSRRNIWNIIQKGHARRTILVTTHFLDEADVLADHIVIVYKGRLVCEGPGTSLKARFGDNYVIRSDAEEGDSVVWRTSNSAEATRKMLELEALTGDSTYDVVFPTLEQVFLKVTSDQNTAVLEQTGDGIVGEEQTNTVIDEKIFALETEAARDIDLDVGHSIGLARQVWTLFRKRFSLLLQKSSWIAYGINLLIPIIIASALVKFLYKLDPLQTCQANIDVLRNSSASDAAQQATYGGTPYTILAPLEYYNAPEIYTGYSGSETFYTSAFVGPASEFSGSTQDSLYLNNIAALFQQPQTYSSNGGYRTPGPNSTYSDETAFSTRQFVNDTTAIIAGITNSSSGGFYGFGIFSPTPESAVLFHSTADYMAGVYMDAFSLITNRIRNSSTNTGTALTSSVSMRSMRHITNNVNFLSLPITFLIVLAFVTASSIAIIYPAYEKINHVRALHYCNGVSPFALWFGYLLFDIQFIIIQAIFVWGLLFAGTLSRLWYGSSAILGVFILFGIATYLGNYVLSLFVKKAAFAISAGLHVLLVVLYLVSYIMVQSFGDAPTRPETYALLQYGLGLSSPAANLCRALFLASNSFQVLCGKYGDSDTSNLFAYVRFGSVYSNLLIQIVFLVAFLAIYEYGSSEWFRRNITHRGVPARLHYIVETGPAANEQEKNARVIVDTSSTSPQILQVSRISKYFGKVFAAENISFNVSAKQTLALLGGNGAGKTTVINMIRGELKPDFGDIHLDGTSVLRNVQKCRMHMGVCPQDDAVDNLTVRQTLAFYASVKGLRNVESNVDKVLNALNITIYEHLPVNALSGGTKRKLSVAIALLGNPRVLLLDEPSTGQDAGAKRVLWKALQDISANRAILLTTHSMEEAEALATNVAIMGTKMLATGTLSSLQETYGGAFGIRAVRLPGASAENVESLVKERFEDTVSNYYDSHGQISFNLPHDKRALGSIMKIMESLKGNVIEDEEEAARNDVGGSSAAAAEGSLRVLQDYTITGPTLEEVFMNVARESGLTGGA